MVLVPGMMPTTAPQTGQAGAQPGQPTPTNPTGTPLPGVAGPTTQTSAGTVPGGSTGGSSGTPSLFSQANSGTTDQGYTASAPPASTGTAAPSVPGGSSGSQFQAITGSPGGNLVGTQINPTTSAATNQYGAETQNAASNVANNQPNLQNLNNQAFSSWVNENNPVYQQALRSASDQAAATGSLGSGQLETGIGSLADTFAQQAMAAQTSGALSAAQQDFTNTNTAAGTLGNLQNTSFGQGVSNTNQLDQQQQNQEGLQQQAVTNNANQLAEQQSIDNSQVGNAATEADIGYAQNPASFEAGLGNTYGTEAGNTAAGAGNLLGNYAYQQALNPSTSSTGNTTAGTVPIPASATQPVAPVTNDPYTTDQQNPLPPAPYIDPNQYTNLQSYS